MNKLRTKLKKQDGWPQIFGRRIDAERAQVQDSIDVVRQDL
jgi:hypothetical protein